MECVILVPATEDWDKLTEEVFLKRCKEKFFQSPSEEMEQFVSNVKNWNRTRKLSYTMYRHLLKQITLKNWSRVNCRVVISDARRLTRDQCAIICDDDDWLHPAIAGEVEEAFNSNPHVDIVYWDSWQYYTHWRNEGFGLYNVTKIGSNALAIRGGLSPYYYCGGAHVRVEEDMPPDKFYYIPNRALSIWNIHPGSFWQRSRWNTPEIGTLKRCPRPQCLDWAVEEIEAMFNLVSSLRETVASGSCFQCLSSPEASGDAATN